MANFRRKISISGELMGIDNFFLGGGGSILLTTD